MSLSSIFTVVEKVSLEPPPLEAWPHWKDEPTHSQFCTSVMASSLTPPSKLSAVVVCDWAFSVMMSRPSNEPSTLIVQLPPHSNSFWKNVCTPVVSTWPLMAEPTLSGDKPSVWFCQLAWPSP